MKKTPSTRVRSLTSTARTCIAFAALICGAALQQQAQALEIDLPGETAIYRESDLPGYKLTLQNCLMCHSAQYAQYQPTTSPRSYWEATVKKMKKPFGATFPDDDIPAIVDYLSKTYGAESTAGANAAAAAKK